MSAQGTEGQNGPEIDTSVPHSARVWNYWLGGKDNYPIDREVAEKFRVEAPGIAQMAAASRAFLTRAVSYLAGEAGVRQFLDIGTGLPTQNNTHEVAQALAPDAHVVYVDNDPLVLTHARALLTSTPEGRTEYIHADLYEPEAILAEVGKVLDFDQPVALMLMGILGHVDGDEKAASIVRRLMEPLPSGSYLTINDGTNVHDEAAAKAQDDYNDTDAVPYNLRSPETIGGFFEGLQLVEPGLVSVTQWRYDEKNDFGAPPVLDGYGAVGRKP